MWNPNVSTRRRNRCAAKSPRVRTLVGPQAVGQDVDVFDEFVRRFVGKSVFPRGWRAVGRPPGRERPGRAFPGAGQEWHAPRGGSGRRKIRCGLAAIPKPVPGCRSGSDAWPAIRTPGGRDSAPGPFCRASVCRMVLAVMSGLSSMSPPAQDPNLTIVGSCNDSGTEGKASRTVSRSCS